MLTLGQAAAAAGVTRKAIRVYEARGLLTPAGRTAAGYRLYTGADVDTLTFIRRALALGLSLDGIAAILAIRRGGSPPCGAVRALLEDRMAGIDRAIADLQALRATLAAACRSAGDLAGHPAAVCPIIDPGR
jgi:MerR family transcriptional regulator, copper efflux regulator